MELVIFAAFVAIQYAAKALPSYLKSHGKVAWVVSKLSDNHFVVWLAHPAVVHGVHDYIIHFVIYSGYVIRAH